MDNKNTQNASQNGTSWLTPAGGLDNQIVETPAKTDDAPIEKRICCKCGAEISAGSSFCSRCGSAANSEKAQKRIEQFRKIDVANFAKKNKKPLLIGLAVCVVLAIVIIVLTMGNPKSKKGIMEDIGENITVLLIDDEPMRLDIKALEIEKRKTKDGVDEVYCKITMDNDNIAVTSYQLLTYTKYNGNKWILESTAPYETEQVEILKPSAAMYDKVVGRIEYGNSLLENLDGMIDDYEVTCDGNTVEYDFEVSRTAGVVSTSGRIYVKSELRGDRTAGYYMSASVDTGKLTTTWNVIGKWSGHETNYGTGWYELSFYLSSLTTEAMSCYWEYENKDSWGKDYYNGDENDCWIIESDSEHIKIGVHYGTALLSSVYVYFYADGTAEVQFPFVGMADMEKT